LLEFDDILELVTAVIYVVRALAFSVSLAELLYNVLMADACIEK
jgi:hypothetical protein